MGLKLTRIAGGAAALLAVAGSLTARSGSAEGTADLAKTPATPVSVAAPAMEAPAEAPAALRYGVFRFSSYPLAWTAAQKTNRPILVFVTSPSCPHCTRMLGETYRQAGVSRFVADSFETVIVDRFEQPALAAKLHVRLFPTTIVVAPNNKVIDVIEGYVDGATFSRRLQTTLAAQSSTVQTR
jgi:thioredoxin-like negative regulator of GroEL